jgi:hypothetical protein
MSIDRQQQRPTLINKGDAVRAVYLESEIIDYANNPLIESLPPIRTVEQAMAGLAHYPKYSEAQCEYPDHIRYQLIQNGMKFFAPLDVHIDLERRFACLLRIGYAGRNPLEKSFWDAVESRTDSFDQYGDQCALGQDDSSWTATGFNIVGMSGVGKSRSVRRILNLYPQVIHHSNYRDRDFTHSQLVWLKLDCPFDGNPKGLCIDFFNAVDSLLGTNYRRNYAGTRRMQDELLSDMALVAANHFLGVLVIDEIQRLSLAKSGGAEKMLNFFVHLINTIGVPVVLVGTYKALPILSGDFSQMRRGTGQGDLVWDRMARDEQWQLFVESLWRFQYTRKKCTLKDTPALSDVLYDETQGITDLAVKVYMFAQERAIDSGKEMVSGAIIRSVAKDKLRIPKVVLDALRLGDKRALAMFEDVYPTILENCKPQLPEGAQITGKLASMPEVKALLEPSALVGAEQQPEAPQAMQIDSNTTSPEGIASPSDPVINIASKARRTSRTPKDMSPGIKKGELLRVVDQPKGKNGIAAYDALRQANYIRPSDEYLGEVN